MGNSVLAYDNQIELATLSGGAWTLALNNLKTKPLSQIARTTNALVGSTTFSAALPSPSLLGLLSLEGTNLSIAATYRWRTFSDAGQTAMLYDSGTLALYPANTIVLPQSVTPPGSWTGLPTLAEIARFQRAIRHVIPVPHYAQYFRLDITDTANTAGYIQAGRAFAGRSLRPEVNLSHGTTFQPIPRTEVLRAVSGEKFFSRKRADYAIAFSFDYLSEAEAMQALDLAVLCDLEGDVVFIWDPDEIASRFRKSIYGQLGRVDPIRYPNLIYRSAAFQVEGLL